MTPTRLYYGTFSSLCARIHTAFNEMAELNERFSSTAEDQRGLLRESLDAKRRELRARVKDLTENIEDWGHPELAESLVRSAKMGLRCPLLLDSAFPGPEDYDVLVKECAGFLNDHGINEILVPNEGSNFGEILKGFLSNSWQVLGVHKLPQRYRETYGRVDYAFHLVRPVFPGSREDWED